MKSEPTVGEIRKALAGQPDDAPVTFILGGIHLRVNEAWPKNVGPGYVFEFDVPDDVSIKL